MDSVERVLMDSVERELRTCGLERALAGSKIHEKGMGKRTCGLEYALAGSKIHEIGMANRYFGRPRCQRQEWHIVTSVDQDVNGGPLLIPYRAH